MKSHTTFGSSTVQVLTSGTEKSSGAYPYFLPVWTSSGEHEVVVQIVLVMREVRVCINVYHPRSAITTDT